MRRPSRSSLLGYSSRGQWYNRLLASCMMRLPFRVALLLHYCCLRQRKKNLPDEGCVEFWHPMWLHAPIAGSTQ